MGGGRRRSAAQRGDDLRYNLELTFMEAAFGVKTKIKIPRMVPCELCSGSGAAPGAGSSTCPTCQGQGQIRYQQGFFSISRTCHHCQGKGTIIKNPCKECRGEGRVHRERTLELKIPAGVDNGQRMRLSGEGEAGVHGGPSGDLDVVFFVKEHEIFERQQNNIYCTIPISISQAALGAEVTIPTLEGEDKLKIPEGTQSGKIFSLRGKGIASPTGKGRGDQYVRVNVTIPTKLTREQRKLLEQFAEVSDISNKPLERKILDKVKDIFG
jgi:molecular chaperone DnaJ